MIFVVIKPWAGHMLAGALSPAVLNMWFVTPWYQITCCPIRYSSKITVMK